MTDLGDRYWRNCFVRALRERWRARGRGDPGGARLDIDNALLRYTVRRQPSWKAQGLRPLGQASHHGAYTNTFTELDTRSTCALHDGRRTNAVTMPPKALNLSQIHTVVHGHGTLGTVDFTIDSTKLDRYEKSGYGHCVL